MTAPTFEPSKKYLQIAIPGSEFIPYLIAAVKAGLNGLVANEHFMNDANSPDAVNSNREAQYVFHAMLEGIGTVTKTNYQELQAYYEQLAAWQAETSSIPINFADDASPTDQEG